MNEMNLQNAGGLWQGPRTRCSQCSILPVGHATRSVSSPCLCLLREGLFGLGVILIYSMFDLPFGKYVGSSSNLYSILKIWIIIYCNQTCPIYDKIGGVTFFYPLLFDLLTLLIPGKEKNPRFVEEVAALIGKDDVFIVVGYYLHQSYACSYSSTLY